jgi:hypothetical protein
MSSRVLRERLNSQTYPQFCTSIHGNPNFTLQLLLWNRNMEATIISMVNLDWVDILPKRSINIVVKGLDLINFSTFMGLNKLSLLT